MAATPVLRICTYNCWGEAPAPDQRMALAARQLVVLEPDVVALQEASETAAHDLGRALGLDVFCDAPLAILSRFKVESSWRSVLPGEGGEAFFLSAKVLSPSGPVYAHSAHLEWRLDRGDVREAQVVAIDRTLRERAPGQLHLLCGDFNATPESDEIRFLGGLTTLDGRRAYYQDAWQRCHPGTPGFTWSSEIGEARRKRTVDFDRRIDYVFASARQKSGVGTVLRAEVVLTARDPDSAGCASDHFGLLAEVQIAANPEPFRAK